MSGTAAPWVDWIRIGSVDSMGNEDGWGWLHLDESSQDAVDQLNEVLAPLGLVARAADAVEIADFCCSDWVEEHRAHEQE